MASVTFSKVGKTYPGGTTAVTDLSLEVGDGEFLVLVGPSGCGKTTALRMVAGLEEITTGEILIGDTVVNNLEPRRRDVAMVFQNYALYPHMSVYDNIAFPLRHQRLSKPEIKERVIKAATLLGLQELLKRKPRTLSGGQRQRVAMGRAIVRRPQVFLMDEPLSNLDAKLRVQMRSEIARLQHELSATTIYVTHDQVEAMTMGTRIAVTRKGVLQQEGAPQDLYDGPANLFVATFIGSPAMNLVRARVDQQDGGLVCRIRDHELHIPQAVLSTRSALLRYAGRELALGIRPEDAREPIAQAPDRPRLRGLVRTVESLGSERLVRVGVDADPVVTEEVLEVVADIDEAAVDLLRLGERVHEVLVVCRFDARSSVKVDESVEVAIDTDRLHFFDLETGDAVEA